MSESSSESIPPPPKPRGVGKSVLRYIPSQVIPTVVAFAAVPILTRMTDQAEYGMFVLVMTIVQTVNQSAYSWISNCALRFYRPMKGGADFFFHLLFCYLFTGLVLAAVLVPLWTFMSPRYQSAMIWAAPIALCACGITIQSFVLRAQSRALTFGLMMALNTLMRYVPAIIAITVFGPTLRSLFGGWLVGYALNLLLILALSGGYKGLLIRRPDPAMIREWLMYGGPLMVTGLVAAATRSTDRFLLDSIGGVEQLAIYGVCIQLSLVPMRFAATTVTLAVLPLAIDAHERQQDIQGLIRSGVRYLFLVSIPGVAILGVLGQDILPLYAPKSYASGAQAIPLLLLAGLFLSLCYHYRTPFLVSKRTGILLVISVCSLMVAVVLNLLLIPRWGVTGCAAALMCTNFLMLCLTAVLAAREVRAYPAAWLVVFFLLAGGVTAGIGMGMRELLDMTQVWSIILVAAVQALGYGVLICLNPTNRSLIISVVGRVLRQYRGAS